MSSPDFQLEYRDILASNVQLRPQPLPTFLRISGFAHYEEVISNWYAFFFCSTAEHGFGQLFIDSLLSLVQEKKSTHENISFDSCSVIRERYVEGKRIDLLIYDQKKTESVKSNQTDQETYRNAIIIENKMHADLYNDLEHYYEHISAEISKTGVVLSLVPVSTKSLRFINITHEHLLERVLQNVGHYLYLADSKYLLLLKDFVQEVNSFTKNHGMKEYVSFYFDNAKKIDELAEIKTRAIEELVQELTASLVGSGFYVARKYAASVSLKSDLNKDIIITVTTNQLFSEGMYEMAIWLTGDHPKTWAGRSADFVPELAIGKPEFFVFTAGKTGSQYAVIGKAVIQLDKTLVGIQSFPTELTARLDSWVAFLSRLVQRIL